MTFSNHAECRSTVRIKASSSSRPKKADECNRDVTPFVMTKIRGSSTISFYALQDRQCDAFNLWCRMPRFHAGAIDCHHDISASELAFRGFAGGDCTLGNCCLNEQK